MNTSKCQQVSGYTQGGSTGAAIGQMDIDVMVAHNYSTTSQGVVDLTALVLQTSRQLGRGAFGEVFLGTYSGKEVAVKKVHLVE
jgi:hypothetical protein